MKGDSVVVYVVMNVATHMRTAFDHDHFKSGIMQGTGNG